MPNWCSNSLVLTHPDASMILKAIKAWNEGKFCATFVPEPDYTKVKVYPTFPDIVGPGPCKPDSAWWDWRVQNWGTKWEIDSASDKVDEESSELNVDFSTAWSPPIKVYEALTAQGFFVHAYYYEGGCSFCGRFTSMDGDESFDIKGDSAWVHDNIPAEIDDAFNIADQMAEYEGENQEEENQSVIPVTQAAPDDPLFPVRKLNIKED